MNDLTGHKWPSEHLLCDNAVLVTAATLDIPLAGAATAKGVSPTSSGFARSPSLGALRGTETDAALPCRRMKILLAQGAYMRPQTTSILGRINLVVADLAHAIIASTRNRKATRNGKRQCGTWSVPADHDDA
jgi:hypothetical protein